MKKFTINFLCGNLGTSEELNSFESLREAKEFYDMAVKRMPSDYELERRSNRFYRDTVGVELFEVTVDEDGYEEFGETIELDTYSYTDYVADSTEDEDE